ncbi:MAG: hypothetical protein IJ289_08405 [Clostridia bacterium]|nr:hypothetical protein [Clostridia bacterium]
MIAVYILLALLGLVVLVTISEVIVLIKQKPAQELPDDKDFDYYSVSVNGKKFEEVYLYLSDDKDAPEFSEEEIYNMLLKQSEYMARRFDCSDFRAQLLFKIYKDCYDKLSERCREIIKKTFLDFKYFMDEPGDDSMCYWSENHQILFATAEYLAGQEWQDEIFTNNGMTGNEHMLKAKERIDAWMNQRFNYGFSEYLSNNYLAEDIAPMANLIAYCKDETMVSQMKIIMDILWLDVALNSVNNRLVATSSRMYGNNKAGNFYGNSICAAMDVLWGNDGAEQILGNPYLSEKEKSQIKDTLAKAPNHVVICFTDIVKKGIYVLPEAIRDIALSNETFAVKMGCGLSPDDMVKEGLVGQKPYQIMAQMGAETFTNPQVVNNTLEYLKTNKMFRNSFLGYFRFLTLTIFKPVNWEKFGAKYNIMPHGIATGRGNVYTYRTAHYSMSTSVCKDVDMCGAQDHEWTANIGETLTLFTTHPAGNGEGRYGSSPGYWIGNGRRPMSVQNESVNITIYKLPTKKRLGEAHIADMTHAYMPKSFYDEFEINENTVFARKNGVFVALIADGKLEFKPYNEDSINAIYKNKTLTDDYKVKGEFDLCRFGGEYHAYVTELSDADKESFDEFKERIRNNKIIFGNGKVSYNTYFGKISTSYDGEFKVNGADMQKEFDRYDCKFCKALRKPDSLFVDSGKHTLSLDLKNVKRQTT